jgi:predicted nucleic acid-binding protein
MTTTYLDTSTLMKLLVVEEGSVRASVIWGEADVPASSVLVEVEARAALAAARRGRRVSSAEHRAALAELDRCLTHMWLVPVRTEVVTAACRLAEDEGLRGYDAVHLASAFAVGADIVTSADADLCRAATNRGLAIANPLAI